MSVPVIAISNETSVLTDSQVQAVIPALQAQVTDDFRAYWDVDATLTFLPKGQPLPAGWWQIVLIDNPDIAGALGYHELSSQGTPLGKVFAKLDLDHGLSWTVTLSHELLEMLADPFINWMAQGEDGQIYALEVSDAVEADELGYSIDGVLVSDFVTPGWFEQTENDQAFLLPCLPTRRLSITKPHRMHRRHQSPSAPIAGKSATYASGPAASQSAIPSGSRLT